MNDLWDKVQKIGGCDMKLNTICDKISWDFIGAVNVPKITTADVVFLQNGKNLLACFVCPNGREMQKHQNFLFGVLLLQHARSVKAQA